VHLRRQAASAALAENTISCSQIGGGNQRPLAYGCDGSAVEVLGGRDNLVGYNTAAGDNVFTELGNPKVPAMSALSGGTRQWVLTACHQPDGSGMPSV
jgi:hypothetical protein